MAAGWTSSTLLAQRQLPYTAASFPAASDSSFANCCKSPPVETLLLDGGVADQHQLPAIADAVDCCRVEYIADARVLQAATNCAMNLVVLKLAISNLDPREFQPTGRQCSY